MCKDVIFFSIMVPVYNTEKYLDECINSVLNQDYNKYELILIDDGSTDKSASICDKYASMDSRIRVFHKDNEGLLLTRRFGIKKARYDWFVFLDSDDYWNQGFLSSAVNTIKMHQPDMIIYSYQSVSENGRVLYQPKSVWSDNYIVTPANKSELYEVIASSKLFNGLVKKIVNRHIVDIDEDYSRYQDKKGEDILQSIPLFKNAQKIVYRTCRYYNYRMSISGRGRNFKPKYIYDAECVSNQLYLLLIDECGINSRAVVSMLREYLIKIGNELVRVFAFYRDTKQSIEVCNDIISFNLFKIGLSKIEMNELPRNTRRSIESLISGRFIYLRIIAARYRLVTFIKGLFNKHRNGASCL